MCLYVFVILSLLKLLLCRDVIYIYLIETCSLLKIICTLMAELQVVFTSYKGNLRCAGMMYVGGVSKCSYYL